MSTQGKKGGGSKKYGRNKAKCTVYRVRRKREKNALRKLLKHIRLFPNDLKAQDAVATVRKRSVGALGS